ncbi:ATP-binding protein [Streptomyces sp. NPDC053367]|uniref:ATP-binding protein n=1 Tax=Streptomyces sp. NPDC053367 TaxID=3365700 RepID=UPI0037CFA810
MHASLDEERRRFRAPETAGRARDLTRAFLAEVAPDDREFTNAVLLVVSELVTNAIRHAGGATGFELRTDRGAVVVTVTDASPLPPRPRRTPACEPGGFGWPLVLKLASKVDVRKGPEGKTVEALLSPTAESDSSHVSPTV